jgi:hypothetical protein
LENLGFEKKWVVFSNECSHRGRIKEFTSKDVFNLGGSTCKFPGENFNLSCDCGLDAVN